MSLIVSYFILNRVFQNDKLKIPNINLNFNSKLIQWFLFLLGSSLAIGHLIYLGDLPAFSALNVELNTEAVNIRRQITADAETIVNYIASFNMKAFLPFGLLYLLAKKNHKLYWLLLLIGVVYAFSLMQKSYIVILLMPSLIYAIFNKKWLFGLKHVGIISIVLYSLVLVHNPEISTLKPVDETQSHEHMNKTTKPGKFYSIWTSLKNRVLIVPGKTVSSWFDHIPNDLPYLNGKGYRFAQRFTGENYINYAQELYPIMYPDHAKKGLKGNVNVAHFMYDYANFGRKGLVLSGFILAIVFYFVETMFRNNFKFKLSLNLIPLATLSSQALTTLLFSGGWGLLLGLYYLFIKNQD